MKKTTENQLTKKQKEAIAEQLANFFFGYWKERRVETNKEATNRTSKAVASCSGLLRNFPENPRATT